MNQEDVVIAMWLLRNRPTYSYVMVEKLDNNETKYTVVDCNGGDKR